MDSALENSKQKESNTNLPLHDHIKSLMTTYYQNMSDNGNIPENVYEIIMAEAELPLIESTMEYTGENQSTAASVLGLNRGTFRKKLNHYGII